MSNEILDLAMDGYIDNAEKIMRKRSERPEIPITTIPSLNNKIWGLKRGQIHIIAARASQGKSGFAMQLAWDAAVNGKSVLFLSLEMNVERLLERLFCNIYKINNLEMQYGKFSKSPVYQDQWQKFRLLVKSKKFAVTDMIGRNWQEVDTLIADLYTKPDVIVIDHINHIRSVPGMNDKQTIDDYLEKFSEVIIRYDIVGILCAQINRVAQGENEGEPQEYNLKGTGKLEEIADVIMLLWWPHHANEKKAKEEYKLNVSKNRDGMTGRMTLRIEPQYYSFSDYIPPETPERKNSSWLAQKDD